MVKRPSRGSRHTTFQGYEQHNNTPRSTQRDTWFTSYLTAFHLLFIYLQPQSVFIRLFTVTIVVCMLVIEIETLFWPFEWGTYYLTLLLLFFLHS